MRELTKSFISLSWGMSLLGARQALNFLNPQSLSESNNPAATTFQQTAEAVEQQLGSPLDGVYKAVDQLQRGAVDLAFGVFMPGGIDLSRMPRFPNLGAATPPPSTPATPPTQSDRALPLDGSGQAASQAPRQRGSGWGPIPYR